eukprot:2947766-Rhodomonas_salina.3
MAMLFHDELMLFHHYAFMILHQGTITMLHRDNASLLKCCDVSTPWCFLVMALRRDVFITGMPVHHHVRG